jgi:hypothetical protein
LEFAVLAMAAERVTRAIMKSSRALAVGGSGRLADVWDEIEEE